MKTRYEIRREVVDWADETACYVPALRKLIHIPDVYDVYGNPRAARKTKSRDGNLFYGTPPGLPDFFLPVPCGIYAGLWIVIGKKDEELSDVDFKVADSLFDSGYQVKVGYDIIDVAAIIETYLLQGSILNENDLSAYMLKRKARVACGD